MVTLAELLSDCYARFGFASSPASEVSSRFTRFVNETQREIFSEPGMERWLFGSDTFDSVADTPQYGLPASVARCHKIYEATNRRALLGLSPDVYRTIQPDPTTPTGTPTHYVELGFSPVEHQPGEAGTLYIVSTSAADTQLAYLEGFRAGGVPTTTSVALSGTTVVPFPIVDFLEVTKFYLASPAVGTVSLKDTP